MTTPTKSRKAAVSPSGIAYSYVRFSRPEQLKGDSLRRQMQASKDYADEHNLWIDHSLKFQDFSVSGLYGKNATEGKLAAFFDAVRTGRVAPGSTLLVESLDRLSRDQITEALTRFLNIINSDITVVTLMDNMLYSRATINDNPGSLLLSIVIMMRAHEESSTKAKRVGEAWQKKRHQAAAVKKPMTKMCPEWLELTPDGYVRRPERAALVVRIFEMAAAGHGKRSIAKTFNAEGKSTWQTWKTEKMNEMTGEVIEPETPAKSRIGKTRANGWHDSYIQKILNSEAVLGIFQAHKRDPESRKRVPNGNPIEGYFPAVIPIELWHRCHTRPSAPRGPRMPKLANLFSGIIYDGYTGAVMRYVDKGCRLDGKVRDWRYLQSDITRLKPDVKGQTWPYTHFEGWTLNFLRNVDWSTLTEKQPHDQSVGLRTEKAELAAKVKKLRKDLDKVIKNFISDETSPILQKAVKANATEIAEQLESTEEQLKNITTALERLASERSAMSEGIDEFRALISAGDPHARIRLQTELRRRIKSITLFRHGHPMLIAKDVHWPAVEIIYANGHRQITVTSQLGTAEHHARRQTRDPATGAFIKKPKD